MRKNTFFGRFAQHLVLFTTCLALTSCTSKVPSEDGENGGDGGVMKDQTCPDEGCETDIACASDRDCPDDDTCRPHWCHDASATCRFELLDRDGDGFAPEVCGGRDCDDSEKLVDCPLYGGESCPLGVDVHPNADELCDGYDDDCDGEVDEGLEEPQSCTLYEDPCQTGRRFCRKGEWSSCEGASGMLEICNGVDDDCDDEIDEGLECCKDGFNLISTNGNVDECLGQGAERFVEPDNADFDTAPVLNAVATGPIFGEYQVCWPGDVDIYGWLVRDPEGQTLCITFYHDKGDLDAGLYNPARNRMDLSQSCEDNERLEIPAGHAGEIWYIVVNGWDGATNHYSIRVGDCP